MQMPIIVGVILAIIFLVAFSEWFFHLISGIKEYVLDDVFFFYRIAGMSALSIGTICTTFVVMAMVTECPDQESGGKFLKGLSCQQYYNIKMVTDNLTSKPVQSVPVQE